jgi:hypothetical protein
MARLRSLGAGFYFEESEGLYAACGLEIGLADIRLNRLQPNLPEELPKNQNRLLNAPLQDLLNRVDSLGDPFDGRGVLSFSIRSM